MNFQKLIFATAVALFTPAALASEIPPLEFVNAYIHGLIELEQLRSEALADLKGNPNGTMANCVRSSTGMQLVLSGQINVFNDMKVHAATPLDTVPADISALYSEKVELYKQMGDLCTALMAGPKPGVDYSSMVAESPKITSKLEYIDHTLTMESALAAATLIDQKPDSHNRLNHLVITRDERKRLAGC